MCWLIHLIGNVSSFPAYFPFIGRLNQLLVLSQQVNEDVKHLGSHKYIAHQLSAIYVSLFDLIFIHIILSVHKKHKKAWFCTTLHFFLFLLQQVLNSFKDCLPLSIIRKDIEANFKELKMSLSKEDGSKLDPQLPAHHASWWEWFLVPFLRIRRKKSCISNGFTFHRVSELTQNMISTVLSLSEELTKELNPLKESVFNPS